MAELCVCKDIKIIQIKWKGPFPLVATKDNVAIENEPEAKNIGIGIYQFIGIHPITGPETLLYIGIGDNLAKRISEHVGKEAWFTDYPDFKVYLGEIRGLEPITKKDLENVESVLIYRLSPPYNSSKINSNSVSEKIIVLNYDAKHRLPFEVSNLPEKLKKEEFTFKILAMPETAKESIII